MAGRVTGSLEDLDPRSDLRATFNEPPVVPGRKDVGDALAGGPAALRQFLDATRFRPEPVLGTVHHQFSLWKHGVVCALLHQAPDMVRVEMRNQDCADLAAIDAGSLHVGWQMRGIG